MPLIEAAPDALARVYARSLFEMARDSGGGQATIESTLGELEDILEVARTNPRFGEFLSSRILPVDKREASLRAILSGRASDLVMRFILTLNRKGRLSRLAPIVAAYDELVQESFGRVEVDVYTASPISPDELKVIRDRLHAVLRKEVIVHPYTDGKMLGGLKLQVGDQLIDGSIATQLRRLRDRLDTEGSPKVRAAAERIVDSN
ncbi:MAG: ATP synthase F1 subunit delta [Phycisphaerales bacterium]